MKKNTAVCNKSRRFPLYNTMDEVWKAIKGYEGLYEVSDWGRVRSLGRFVNAKNGSKRWVKGKMLEPQLAGMGYYTVQLGLKNSKYIHRLVAEAFIPNPNNYPEVNHKDENKLNNKIGTLEWCPHRYNLSYGTCNARTAIGLNKTVYQYKVDGELCGIWPSASMCAKFTGFNRGHICNCCLGRCETHKGYIWSYNPPPKALPHPIP